MPLLLKAERLTITKIKSQNDPIEVLSKISPLLNSRRFNSLIEENMKGCTKHNRFVRK